MSRNQDSVLVCIAEPFCGKCDSCRAAAAEAEVEKLRGQLDRIYALPEIAAQGDSADVPDCVEAFIDHVDCIRTECEGAGKATGEADRRVLEEDAAKLRAQLATSTRTIETLQAVASTCAEQAKADHEAAEMLRLTVMITRQERDEVRADLQSISDEDEKAHAMLDLAFGIHEPGTTSMETLTERIPKLVADRDKFREAAATHWANFCERSPDFRRWRATEKERDLVQVKLDDLAQRFTALEAEKNGLAEQLAIVKTDRPSVWVWVGDGSDQLETLVRGHPIVMAAHVLRGMLAKAGSDATEEGRKLARENMEALQKYIDEAKVEADKCGRHTGETLADFIKRAGWS